MAGVKLVVMSPRPKDVDVFEKIYQDEHVVERRGPLRGTEYLGCDNLSFAAQFSDG